MITLRLINGFSGSGVAGYILENGNLSGIITISDDHVIRVTSAHFVRNADGGITDGVTVSDGGLSENQLPFVEFTIRFDVQNLLEDQRSPPPVVP